MRRFLHRAFPLALALAVVANSAGAAHSTRAVSEYGVLQQFEPRSTTTWWAIVNSNLNPKTWVARTTDSGRHWETLTTPVPLVASASFVGLDAGWIEADSAHPGAKGAPGTEPVYRTLDGGQSWQPLGHVRSDCKLDFVDRRHGWCIGIGAAMGSSAVWLYRTGDGGSTWRLVSRTGVAGKGSTRGALPYACNKTIDFTSPRIGWAAQSCNGGRPRVYTTTNGGARWRALAIPRLPKGAPTASAGEGISLPAVRGSRLAVSVVLVGAPNLTNVIATSTNRGRRWRSRLAPGNPRYGPVDLIDTRHFVLSNGTTLLRTNDAGQHWYSLGASKRFLRTLGTPLTPDFVSPRLGFVIPTGTGRPIWWTRNGGSAWQKLTITAGPFTLG